MPAPADSYLHIIDSRHHIWFVGRARLAGYRKEAASWAEYDTIPVTGFSVLGDSVLLAHGGTPFIYDPGSDRWTELQIIGLPDSVTDAVLNASEMLFASTEGLVAMDVREDTRQVWTKSSGLVDDALVRVHSDQQFIYAIAAGGIEYFNRRQALWKREEFAPVQARKERFAWLDDAGAHLGIVPDSDVRLSGRAHYSQSRSFSGGAWTTSDLQDVGLNLAAQHSSGRVLSLFYDDSDKDRIAYGLSYRGVDRDLLHRTNAGKLRSEYSDFDLIPQFSTLGANARIRRGVHSVDLQTGLLESELHSEFFAGRSVDKKLTLSDLNYARGVFYRIPAPVVSQWDTLFADDRDPATNTPITRVGVTVGGINGDFDPLVRGNDYFVDRQSAVVHFLAPRKPGDALVFLTDAGAQVLQSESVTENALRNTYSFGADITPGSFELEITDTAGAVHALSEFGIDNDGDGRVDPAFINHDLGFLSLPSPLVSDSLSPSLYELRATYRSRSAFYNLAHKPIVKNSEAVLVDGAAMTRGSDYVVDYSSGILLFLKEDAVTDFSQIDVRYSALVRDEPGTSKPMLLSAQPALAIADNVTLAPGFTRIADEDAIHVSGRAEAGAGTNRNVRFVPQFAVNTEGEVAQDYSLGANHGAFSAAAQYRGFGAGFEEFGAGDRRYGPLRHSATVSSGVEPLSQFRLEGTAKREYLADTLSWSSLLAADYLSGRLSYLNPKHPNGSVLITNDHLPDGEKQRVRVNAGYEFSLLKSRLRLSGVLQNTELDHLPARTLDRSREHVAEATFSLPFPVQGNVRFRNNSLSSDGTRTRREDEVRGQLNVDVVPGFFYTGSCYLLSEASPLGASQDLSFDGYLYNNLQIAPGRWWSELSVVNLSVGTGSSFDEYVRSLDSAYAPPLLFFSPLASLPPPATVSSAGELRTLYGTVQVQPRSDLTLRAKRTLGRNGTSSYGLPELRHSIEDDLKAEYEPARLGRFTAQFTSRQASGLPRTTHRSLYFEWNRPWAEQVRTRLTATYGFDKEYYSPGLTLRPRSIASNVEAIFYFNARSYATAGFGVAGEQRSFSATASSWVPDPWKASLRPAAGFNLSLLRFLYVQFNHQSSLTMGGSTSHSLSARLTTQF